MPFFPIGALVAWVFAEAFLANSQVARARDLLRRQLSDVAWHTECLPTQHCRVLEVLTRSELALGRTQEAAEAAALAEEVASGCHLAMPGVFARWARCAVLLAERSPSALAQASSLAREAVSLAGGVNARLEEARSRLLTGRALALAGERDHAVAELEAAAGLLGACGAEGSKAEAMAALRRLRNQPGGRRATDGVTLTAREQEVAALAIRHLTTVEIAAELFISAKTVETHLAHIYAKLGVSSRRALARALTGEPAPR